MRLRFRRTQLDQSSDRRERLARHGVASRMYLLALAIASVAGVTSVTSLTPNAPATYWTYSCSSCDSTTGPTDWVQNAYGIDYTRYSVCAGVGYLLASCNSQYYTAIACLGSEQQNEWGWTESLYSTFDHLAGHEDNYRTCS